MADANDGRVTLWEAPTRAIYFAFPVVDAPEYIARPRADDEARTERIEKLRDEGFAMHAAYNEATRDRGEWRRRAEAAEAEREVAVAKAAVIGGEWCAENRAAGRGPCGSCSWCCAQSKNRADAAEAARDSARALLKEARVAVDLWTDDHRCGEDVSLKPEYAAQLRARIDAETRGEDGPGTRRDDETDSNPTDTRNHARAAGNGAATPP